VTFGSSILWPAGEKCDCDCFNSSKLCFMLESHRLRVLWEVANSGSFSAAADSLQYTPSAISQQVAALERAVGGTLVSRGRRGIVLTEAGRALVRHADHILTALEAAEAEVQALIGLRAGVLRVGWFATAGASLMPRAIAGFRARHPDVHLSLREADPEECAARLREHDLDVALVYEFDLARRPLGDLRQHDLLEDRLYVALPPGNPLVTRSSLFLEDLADESWVQGVRSGSTLEVLPAACRAVGFEPRIAFQTDDHMALQGLVAAGVGIGLIPSIALPTARQDIEVRPVSRPQLVRRVRAALPPGEHGSPAAEALLDVLERVSPTVVDDAMRYLQGEPAPSKTRPRRRRRDLSASLGAG
jgi:DNA-binding transcriptional LysR family regulator